MNQTPPPPVAPRPALVRDPSTDFGGVASGLAHYLDLDVALVRIVFILLTLTTGFGVIAYLAAWAVIPAADQWPPVDAARPPVPTVVA